MAQLSQLVNVENPLIKARVTIGPISLDVEDDADKLTLLVTKIVESFMNHKIIGVTSNTDVVQQLEKVTTR